MQLRRELGAMGESRAPEVVLLFCLAPRAKVNVRPVSDAGRASVAG
jgi:hypothetical protein